jgi:hypothetical protein
MLTSVRQWRLRSLRPSPLPQLLLAALLTLLLLRKLQLRKRKRKTTPLASKDSDLFSVEARSKREHYSATTA